MAGSAGFLDSPTSYASLVHHGPEPIRLPRYLGGQQPATRNIPRIENKKIASGEYPLKCKCVTCGAYSILGSSISCKACHCTSAQLKKLICANCHLDLRPHNWVLVRPICCHPRLSFCCHPRLSWFPIKDTLHFGFLCNFSVSGADKAHFDHTGFILLFSILTLCQSHH